MTSHGAGHGCFVRYREGDRGRPGRTGLPGHRDQPVTRADHGPGRGGVDYVALDLASDPASIEALAARLGAVDVLVNNAGESQSGPFEELPGEALRRLFQVNVLRAGAAHPARPARHAGARLRPGGHGGLDAGVVPARLPLVLRGDEGRAQGFQRRRPARALAVRGLADHGRARLDQHRHQRTPHQVRRRRTRRTGATSRRCWPPSTATSAPASPPERVAATIVKAIEAARPKARYAVGSNAPLVFALRRVVPATLVEKLTHRRHDLKR